MLQTFEKREKIIFYIKIYKNNNINGIIEKNNIYIYEIPPKAFTIGELRDCELMNSLCCRRLKKEKKLFFI